MLKKIHFICLALIVAVPVLIFGGNSAKAAGDLEDLVEFDTDQVLNDVYALVDSEKQKLFHQRNSELDKELIDLFDVSILRSKLEQFYTMLFLISKYASIEKDEIVIDPNLAIKLLISSEVFSDLEFPKKITKIFLSRKERKNPFYKVFFDSNRVELELNRGDGYGIKKEGMHQQAKALVFYGSFSFSLKKKGENVVAYNFEDVDLYGFFGSRGIINVDINYVAIKSVEFHKGSEMALVTAKVSRKEFEINEHTWLLALVTKFVNDKCLQSIDW